MRLEFLSWCWRGSLIWGRQHSAWSTGTLRPVSQLFATISDLFPNSAVARVTALTGIAGGFSGWLFPILTGWLVDKISFQPVFFLAAIMPAAGVLALWSLAGKKNRAEVLRGT